MTYQLIYPGYRDMATGKTLVVTPGSAYTIALTGGAITSTPAYPNDGRWTSTTAFLALEAEPQVKSRTPKPTVSPVTDASDTSKEGA